MSVPQRNIRSLQDIPTLSGRVDQTAVPHRAYMRIACLELEKFRRGKERESAAQRVENINSRCREIEAEKAALLQALGERKGDAPEPTPRESKQGFRLRY